MATVVGGGRERGRPSGDPLSGSRDHRDEGIFYYVIIYEFRKA